VCYQCYKFYTILFNLVIKNGKIKMKTLNELSDPQFRVNKEKERSYKEINDKLAKELK